MIEKAFAVFVYFLIFVGTVGEAIGKIGRYREPKKSRGQQIQQNVNWSDECNWLEGFKLSKNTILIMFIISKLSVFWCLVKKYAFKYN